MTLLLVDDNPDDLYQLEVLLGAKGYRVVTARHGQEALILARQQPPDLVISDVLMPVMDGFALCREWQHDERLRGIPFLFYTATYTDERDREFGLSLGARRFLIKPETPALFFQAIEEAIHQVEGPVAAPGGEFRLPEAAGPERDASALQQYNETLIQRLEANQMKLVHTRHELEQDIAARKRAEATLQEQLAELRRWHAAMLHREDRVMELKREVNQLLADAGRSPRYASVALPGVKPALVGAPAPSQFVVPPS